MNNRAILGAIFFLSLGGLPRGLSAETPAHIELLEEAAIRSAVERIRPAVVRIDLIGTTVSTGEVESAGPTTGLIVDADGFVLTSAFAFSTPPASILITLDDSSQSAAKLVAVDRSRQLALLKLEGDHELQAGVAARRGDLAVGQWAIAVGRVLASDRPSVSVGILSALERIQGKAIQTDAAISPANYGGPLIDITGGVMGVLTPLGPDDSGANGAQWYDSGIGFAVPLAEYESSLARLKSGENLYRGLIGIALEKGNAMEVAPIISNVRRSGPADRAGLRVGDKITAINAEATPTQSTFQRLLGRYYAGDSVSLMVLRDDAQIKLDALLVQELEPFRHAALGFLTKSSPDDAEHGVIVEKLLPKGPAEAAGINLDDRIVKLDRREIASVVELEKALVRFEPGEEVNLTLIRDGKTLDLTAKLAERSAEMFPNDAADQPEAELGELAGTEREFKLPEFSTACPLYVPSTSSEANPPGLLVVLQSGADQMKPDELSRWKHAAERNNLILAMPGPQDKRDWSGGDLEWVKQLIRTLIEREGINGNRVALVGVNCPNRVTIAMWLTNRELVRGAVLGSTELTPRIRLPENDPDTPCLFLIGGVKEARETQRIISQLKDRGFASTVNEKTTPAEVAAWAKSLDRI